MKKTTRVVTPDRPKRRGSRSGTTLIEVVIALALVVMICGGLIALTLQTRRLTEHNRIATEARALGKQRMEDLMAVSREALEAPMSELLAVKTIKSSLGHEIEITPQIAWHAADGTIVAPADSAYTEIRVAVHYDTPLFPGQGEDSYSAIMEE